MIIARCKMCGGQLELTEGMSVIECEYCGSRQTVPNADNDKKMTLFARADRLRSSCEFDKAFGIYESIVTEYPEEAEAYWGLILCKYGIEYVDDAATGKKVPTCHRSSYKSIFEDDDLEQALENADVLAREVYRNEAKEIEELRKGIIEVSGKEEPYDVFICYKEADENGERTVDSVLAQEAYEVLVEKGYRVFFSRITLEDKLGQEYEPYIFAALNSSKVMLAFGTSYEHYNAVWVKNEWSRFLSMMAEGQKKTLIPCYKGIDAYDIPKEFSHLQAQDIGKVGAFQDLVRGIEKIIPRKKENEKSKIVYQEEVNIENLFKRAKMALENYEWRSAREFYDQVLDENVEESRAYLGLFMVEKRIITEDRIPFLPEGYSENKNYKLAYQYGNADMKKKLDGYHSQMIFHNISKKRKSAVSVKEVIKQKERLQQLFGKVGLDDAVINEELTQCENKIQEIEENERNMKYQNACTVLKQAETISDVEEAELLFFPITDYRDVRGKLVECREKKEKIYYDSADRILKDPVSLEHVREAWGYLENISEYMDAKNLRLLCKEKEQMFHHYKLLRLFPKIKDQSEGKNRQEELNQIEEKGIFKFGREQDYDGIQQIGELKHQIAVLAEIKGNKDIYKYEDNAFYIRMGISFICVIPALYLHWLNVFRHTILGFEGYMTLGACDFIMAALLWFSAVFFSKALDKSFNIKVHIVLKVAFMIIAMMVFDKFYPMNALVWERVGLILLILMWGQKIICKIHQIAVNCKGKSLKKQMDVLYDEVEVRLKAEYQLLLKYPNIGNFKIKVIKSFQKDIDDLRV